VQTIQLRSTNRVGDTTESVASLQWMMFDDGLSKALLRFHRPLETRGSGVLLIEKKDRTPDTFLYLPEVGQVRRVSSSAASNSLFGTDFSYEDFNRLVGMAGTSASVREPDVELEGRAAWVITARPAPADESAYERIVMTVDQKTCVALRTESWEPGEQLRKVLTADPAEIIEQNSLWIPRRLTMRDQRDETQTDVIVEEVVVNASIKQKMFSARELEAGAR
jgi:outer membrane lipoprotein-sorting protein